MLVVHACRFCNPTSCDWSSSIMDIAGVRINLEALTDIIEASALNFQSDYIQVSRRLWAREVNTRVMLACAHPHAVVQVYSNSWGPSDLGFVVAGPGTLTQMVFQQGVKTVS